MNIYSQWPVPAGGSGTVTSVGLLAPSSVFSVSGSPVTTTGNLTLTLQTQVANSVWAGPTSGGAATPTFRALVASDIPSLAYALDSFTIIQPDSGTSPTASTASDTLTLTNTDGFVAVSGNSGAKSITFALGSNPPTLTHFYYIDKNGNDSTGNGSALRPYLTISKALTVIGPATNTSDFNDATKTYYSIRVAPGVYTENLSVPTRPVIVIDLTQAKVVGNVTQNFDQNIIGAGAYQQAKLLIYGQDLRSTYNSATIPWTGIDGNIIISSITGGSSLTSQLHLLNTGCTGNITMQQGSGGGTFTGQVFLENAIVAGTIQTSGTPGFITLYAANVDTSGSFAIGGVTGAVILNILRNVRFDGAVVTSGGGGRWFNVDFKASTAHDFTGSSSTVYADANSINSFKVNVPTPGSMAFTYADTAKGVGYTPTTPGNWSPVPTTVLGALDTLAAAVAAGGVTTVGSFDGQSPVANALVISGSSIYAQSADATHPGMVNISTQTFAGNKTFKGNILLAGATSGTLTHSVPATVTSYSLVWPSAQAAGSGYLLSNDGSGNLSWVTGASGVTTVGTYDSQTVAANGLVISGTSIYAQSADATHPGMMSTGTQTFAGAKTWSGNQTFSGSALKGNYHMEPSEANAGNSGSSITIDMSTGSIVLVTLNAATPAITLSNPQAGAPYLLKVAQDGTGSRVPSFSTTIDWGTLGAPTFTTTASKVDYLQLVYSGSGWRGLSYALGYSA